MTIGILVPIVLFFGGTVFFAAAITGAALKNIENDRATD